MEVGAFAIQILLQLPELMKAGADVYDIIRNAANTINKAQAEGRDITDQEWEESNDAIEDLQAERDEATKDV